MSLPPITAWCRQLYPRLSWSNGSRSWSYVEYQSLEAVTRARVFVSVCVRVSVPTSFMIKEQLQHRHSSTSSSPMQRCLFLGIPCVRVGYISTRSSNIKHRQHRDVAHSNDIHPQTDAVERQHKSITRSIWLPWYIPPFSRMTARISKRSNRRLGLAVWAHARCSNELPCRSVSCQLCCSCSNNSLKRPTSALRIATTISDR